MRIWRKFRQKHGFPKEYTSALLVREKIKLGGFDNWLDYLMLAIRLRKEELRKHGKA